MISARELRRCVSSNCNTSDNFSHASRIRLKGIPAFGARPAICLHFIKRPSMSGILQQKLHRIYHRPLVVTINGSFLGFSPFDQVEHSTNVCLKRILMPSIYKSDIVQSFQKSKFVISFENQLEFVMPHWGRVSVDKLNIIASDNCLSSDLHEVIIWTNAGILLLWLTGTDFNDIFIDIHTFSFFQNAFENVICEMAAILAWPQCVNRKGRTLADVAI